MRAARLLLVAFGLVAAADLVFVLTGADAGHTVAKSLLLPLLAACAVLRGAPRALVAALLCGWAGDVLLLSDADPAFLAGMAAFAAGHVCYLTLFRTAGSPRVRAALLVPGYAAVLVTLVVLLWPDLPAGLRVPVAAYSALLTAMACAAAGRFGLVAGLGGALFMVSDTLIATSLADWPQPPYPGFWVMLTYAAAQFLLVQGTLGERQVPAATYGEVRSTTP
ncbi:lysoplasmalogenase [Streptomyces adustus]|uniref:lysoplasmalogenase n=1 Tax=Streptomyces adustus TaxID=1609272 RepID=UPI00371F6392